MLSLKNKRILIISPHPDDEAIGCGGLISVAKRQGATVYVLFMCLGTSRQLVTGSTGPDTRLVETKNAAKFGNYEYEFVYIGEQWLRLDTVPQRELNDKIEDKIADFKPDIVLIPARDSYDQDHRATFTAAITAMRPIPTSIRHRVQMVLEYEEPYTWTVNDIVRPNLYLELTKEDIQAKCDLLKCHLSQCRETPFPRSFENLTRLAGTRGAEIGVHYAEAYKLLRGVID